MQATTVEFHQTHELVHGKFKIEPLSNCLPRGPVPTLHVHPQMCRGVAAFHVRNENKAQQTVYTIFVNCLDKQFYSCPSSCKAGSHGTEVCAVSGGQLTMFSLYKHFAHQIGYTVCCSAVHANLSMHHAALPQDVHVTRDSWREVFISSQLCKRKTSGCTYAGKPDRKYHWLDGSASLRSYYKHENPE